MARSWPDLGRRSVIHGGLVALLACIARRGDASGAAETILTIESPSKRQVHLSDSDIRAMRWTEIRTHSRWTSGLQDFRGPRLSEVLLSTGLSRAALYKTTLHMVALNDFRVDVPARDAWDYDPILAREQNGQLMRIRDKGPLWLVYPRDRNPLLQNIQIDARWIWQLQKIVIR